MASIITAAAAVGTVALFHDSKTSANNKIEAGKFSLMLDNECHYDGMVCSQNATTTPYIWVEESQGSSTYPELIGEPCECTWEPTADMENKLFFNFDDVKPGDNGENTISLHVDDNPAWICADLSEIKNFDNGCTSAESADGDVTCGNPGENEGELQDFMAFNIWLDNGAGDHKCNNIKDDDETYVAQDIKIAAGVWPVVDSSTATSTVGAGITDACVGVSWNVPLETGNIIQTDSLMGDITFTAYQTRNNLQFRCAGGEPEPEKGSLKVNKVTVNGNGTFNFTGNNGIDPFQIVTTANAGSSTITGLDAGTYSITEATTTAGWTKTGDTCQNVAVTEGQTAECTITNTYEQLCLNQGDVMLVLDRSGSVSPEMSTLKTAALAFVTSLNPNGGVHMGQSSFATTGTLDTALTGNQTLINAGINGLVAGGTTNLFQGLTLATTELNANGRLAAPDFMILITDGNPNQPGTVTNAHAQALAAATAAKTAGTTIFAVGVGGVDATYLQSIASPGKYFPAANYTQLDSVLQGIASCSQ